ncbi:hypothetical protein RJT34_17734 [Clitoria ternatea]|uniref:Uncharacterized protein n=1 Tax=Clitoria ternatea TaxID=43366 RepID=A0AAN9J9I0_CLITE
MQTSLWAYVNYRMLAHCRFLSLLNTPNNLRRRLRPESDESSPAPNTFRCFCPNRISLPFSQIFLLAFFAIGAESVWDFRVLKFLRLTPLDIDLEKRER